MCNRLPTHVPGNCPEPKLDWDKVLDKVESLNDLIDARRDAELATLRAQLADAAEVMSAMREDLEETLGYASEYFRDKWDLGSSLKKLDEYKAKYGAK